MQAKWSVAVVVLSMLVTSVCQAVPGSGIRVNQWLISPSISGSAIYDSNVLLTQDNEESDTFMEGVVALDVLYMGGKVTLGCRLFGISRTYSDMEDLDYSSAGESLRLEFRRPSGMVVQADQSYRVVEDLDRSGLSPAPGDVSATASPVAALTAAERSRRELLNAGVRVSGDMSDKVDASLAYAYAMADYDLDFLFDSSEHVALAEGGYRITDKTVAILNLQYGMADSDAFSDNTDFAAVRAGFRSRGTDKVQYKGGVGWQTYMRPDGAGDDVNGVSVNVIGQWQATDKVMVFAGARNDLVASSLYRNNVRETSSVWIGLNCKPITSIETVINGGYSREEHEDPVDVGGGEMKARKDDSASVSARITYTAPVQFVSVFAEATYAMVDSNISDYNEVRTGAGVTVRY
jgi:hypothetical protein